MELKQLSPHLSIKDLPPTSLPPLTILTSVNGAGKTHLLKAIETGKVYVDCAPKPKQDVKFFDWTNLVPNEANRIPLQSIYADRDNICDQIRVKRNERKPNLIAILRNHGLGQFFPENPWKVADLSVDQFKELMTDTKDAQAIIEQIKSEAIAVTNNVRAQIKNHIKKQSMIEDILQFRTHIATIDENYFNSQPLGWKQESMFQQSFAEMFLGYYEKYKNNRFRQLDKMDGRHPDSPPLSEDEFVEKHGALPWEFVNEMMLEAKIRFLN